MPFALIVIDIQNDYFPGGAMELVGAEAAAENAAWAIDSSRRRKFPIIHVQHISVHPEATFFLPDTEGVKIHKSVEPQEEDIVVTKHHPNAFRETELLEILQHNNIDDIFFCGMMTHMCVDSTVRAAYDLGIEATVLFDACATRDLVFGNTTVKAADVQAAYLAALEEPFANVWYTEDFCA